MTNEPEFPIENIPMPSKGAGGRPPDERIAEICRRAIKGLACGQFNTTREAARHHTPEFMGEAVYAASDRVTINGRVQDLKAHIEKHMNASS